jgi:thiamine biosynthesis protein ThiS
MKLLLNGKEREVPDRISARGLLDVLGLRPEAVVVERNEEVILRSRLDEVALAPGDQVEIIHAIAGG